MPIRIVFAGTPDFAVPSLTTLLEDDAFHVVAVITQPDRPFGRKQIITPPPVKVVAVQHGIPVFQPEKLNAEFSSIQSQITNHQPPDFLVVVAYGQILSQEVLDWPSIAPINVHASLLPRWRGASPIHHAILAGDTETGVSIQRMAKALDAGPVYSNARIALDPRETTPTLYAKLAPLGAHLLIDTLKNLPKPVEQDAAGITVCGTLSREDGKVDAEKMIAEDIDRRVRALNPWPGVTMMMKNEEVKILETALEPQKDSAPLPCASGTVLHLVKVQRPGGKPISGREWNT